MDKVKENKEKCEHNWIFDYQEFYDGCLPGNMQDIFHCSKCLERKKVEIDEFHHKH